MEDHKLIKEELEKLKILVDNFKGGQVEDLFDFQEEIMDDHKLIKRELSQLKLLITNFKNTLEVMTIKPIPAQLIKALTDVRKELKSHSFEQVNKTSNCHFDFDSNVQQLGSVIDYLHKYNKSLNRSSSEEKFEK